MRDMNPSNNQNWKVVCSACGADFQMDETIDLADGHFKQEHPNLETAHFNIVWVGVGPKPKGGRGAARSHPRGRRRR